MKTDKRQRKRQRNTKGNKKPTTGYVPVNRLMDIIEENASYVRSNEQQISLLENILPKAGLSSGVK